MCRSDAKISVSSSAVRLWISLLSLPAVRMPSQEADSSPEVQELLGKRLIRVTGHNHSKKILFLSDPTLMLTRDEQVVLNLISVLAEPLSVHVLILKAKQRYVLNPLRVVKRLIYLNLIELNAENRNLINPRFSIC